MARARTPRPPKPQQTYIPGTDPPNVPEINRAADAYVSARDARMEALQEEIDLKGKLHLLMKEHELKEYEYDGKIVSVETSEETVKVKRKKPKASENGEE